MRSLLFIVLLAGCTPPSSQPVAMPWLHGFAATASSDVTASDVVARMQSDCEEPCPDFGGIELAADIAPAVGTETILASYAQGVVVLDHRGRVLARRAAFTNMGSADELLAIATGDLQPGRPVIAIATQAGGHREQEVWLELDQIGRNGALDVVFSAIVEVHDGRGDAVGAVTIVPGGILYRAPHAELAVLRKLD